jgi:hypothetical protein
LKTVPEMVPVAAKATWLLLLEKNKVDATQIETSGNRMSVRKFKVFDPYLEM